MSATTINAGFNNVEWYLCHTNVDELSTNYNDNYQGNTPKKVYSNSSVTINAVDFKWFGFPFNSTFAYDGSSNLIFELRYGSHNGKTIQSRGKKAPKRVLEVEDADGTTGAYGIFDNMPSLRIYHNGTDIITINSREKKLNLFTITKSTSNTYSINYSISKSGKTRIWLYEPSGRLVKRLKNSQQNRGSYSLTITDHQVMSGTYLVSFEAGGFKQSKKLVVVK